MEWSLRRPLRKGEKMALCKYCYTEFQRTCSVQKYCCNACAKKASYEKQAERAREMRKKRPQKCAVVEIAAQARAEGLSYGQYVAKYEI